MDAFLSVAPALLKSELDIVSHTRIEIAITREGLSARGLFRSEYLMNYYKLIYNG